MATVSGDGPTIDVSRSIPLMGYESAKGLAERLGGSGKIVMLHGINSDGGDWRTVIDTIGTGYRFIAFDLLGFGGSPKPLDIDYSADEHALVIENTLVDLGIDDRFLLVVLETAPADRVRPQHAKVSR